MVPKWNNVLERKMGCGRNKSTSCSDAGMGEALGAVGTPEARPGGQAKTRRKQGRFRAFPSHFFEKYY
jgi:hypothetical protein